LANIFLNFPPPLISYFLSLLRLFPDNLLPPDYLQ